MTFTRFAAAAALCLTLGCGAKRPEGTMPVARIGAKRVVTYQFSASITGSQFPETRPQCTKLVIEEEVKRVDQGYEQEIAARIVDGSDPILCGVGRYVKIAAQPGRDAGPRIEATPPLDSPIVNRLQYLHRSLGTEDGAFALTMGNLPWNAKPTAIAVDGVPMTERIEAKDTTFGPYPSEGSNSRRVRMLQRASDLALVCVSALFDAHGTNFEYGGWSQRESESIEIDDGHGTTSCK